MPWRPKGKKKRLWWKRGLELVDCGSPGRICPITVSESIGFFSCDGDRLPPGFGRRNGFFLVLANGDLLPPSSTSLVCGRWWQQPRRTTEGTHHPHPTPKSYRALA